MIKTHKISGLKYLCQTTRKDYIKYKGSGDYWKNHLRIHGNEIATELLAECKSKEELKEVGLYYSNLWNIVESKDSSGKKMWANLTPESGTGGRTKVVSANKGKVIVSDSQNNTQMVDIIDPRYLSGELVSITKGTIGVKDVNGHALRIQQDDPRYLAGELKAYSKGRVSVIDTNGDTFQVSIYDSRYLSGELIHIAKGKISVKDKNGKILKVLPSDPKYISGELTSPMLGKVSVKDGNGNKFQVSVDDPRYVSGELIFVGGPSKGYKQVKVVCPHCGITGGISNLKRSHFEKCKSLFKNI